MPKAYAIICLGKNDERCSQGTQNDMSASLKQQKPHELPLVGFSIPFWQGGLSLRLVADYSSPSNHLQM